MSCCAGFTDVRIYPLFLHCVPPLRACYIGETSSGFHPSQQGTRAPASSEGIRNVRLIIQRSGSMDCTTTRWYPNLQGSIPGAVPD
jgi:hypothetical protein